MERLQVWAERPDGNGLVLHASYPAEFEDLCLEEAERHPGAVVRGPDGDVVWPAAQIAMELAATPQGTRP